MTDRPVVVAAVYPLSFVARYVAGAHIEVVDLTPPGVEPHDVELSPDQVRQVLHADLLLYIGSGFQPAVEEVAAGLGNRAVDVLAVVAPLEWSDPHVWLDPTRLVPIADLVARRVAELYIDTASSERAGARAEQLTSRLRDLDRGLQAGLSDCETDTFVTSHAAFAYLAQRYDLTQVSIAGIEPETEPTPQRLAEIVDFVRNHDVSTIFLEPLVSPRVADTIAAETGAHTAVLDPLESRPEQGDYFGVMESNLRALREALQCG